MAETAVVTILFCDLVGSTELLQTLGDDANDGVRRTLLDALGRASDAYGGTVVKSAGDGVMVSFRTSAADAVACGVAMQRAAAQIEHDGETLGLSLRVGISSGEASHESGDWFGTPVVEAARLEAAAAPGQILVSEVVRSIVGTRGGAQFRPAGKRNFKGFPQPVPVIEVAWRTEDDPAPRPVRKRRTSRRRQLIAATAAIAAIAVAASIAAVVLTRESGDTDEVVASGLPLVAEGYAPIIELEQCDPEWIIGAEVICEALVVPENRDRPSGRKIRIMAITYPARVSNGGVPTITLGGFEDNYEESDVREYGDLVSFDIRGGTQSDPFLACPEIQAIQIEVLGLGEDESEPRWLDATRRCGERLVAEAVDLNHYGLEDVVLDVRDFLIAKGWQQVNLQGNGDWARFAVLFAQRYPQVARAVVIADPLPFYAPQDDMAMHVNAALGRYFDACDADEDCARAFGDLRGRPSVLYEQYEAEPIVVVVPNPSGGPDINVYIDGDVLIFILAAALNSQGALPVIAASLSFDTPATHRTAASFLVDISAPNPDDPHGLWQSLYCKDIGPVVSRTAIESGAAVYPHLQGLAAFIDTCAVWPTQPDSALWAEIKVSPVPALILAGELSPWYPPAYADEVAQAFRAPHVVVLPHVTSGPISSGPQCVSDLRVAFLRDPQGELDAETCVQSIPPIQFEGT
jgi:class 3 adenylate cyclase/pimeloyl-ACP methyl ester carboxylesterase